MARVEAAGRGEGGGVGVGEAALDEAVGDEAAQVVGGLSLHPGGDFLGEEFEQEVGHRGVLEARGWQTGSGAGGQGGMRRSVSPRGRRSARLRAEPPGEVRVAMLRRRRGTLFSPYLEKYAIYLHAARASRLSGAGQCASSRSSRQIRRA